MPEKFIYTRDDVLHMLDPLLADGAIRWDELFAAPPVRVRSSSNGPTRTADWFGGGLLTPGDVLELGCGHGRNATYLADLPIKARTSYGRSWPQRNQAALSGSKSLWTGPGTGLTVKT
jgi:hypothetical protein